MKQIILFDGICNLCNASVQYVIEHDPHNKFLFATLQGSAGIDLINKVGLSDTPINSFLLIQNNKVYNKSSAALRVARQLKGPVKLLFIFIILPPFIRNIIYDIIARNRYKWFGKSSECMVPSQEVIKRFLN